MATEQTRPSPQTRAEEAEEAAHAHEAGRGPTPEEEAAADSVEPDPEVADSYRDMTERGARQQGEGRPGV